SSLVFKGEEPLTFAFSCIRVHMDPETGALTLGESVEVRAAKSGPESKRPPKQEYVLLDDDAMAPGFLAWD
ncbi:MAG: hypothetical protein ABIQ93_03395, partial [Saprospiraceae bacterium]